MPAILALVIQYAIANTLIRVLAGISIAIVSHGFMSVMVTNMLASATSSIGSMPATIFSLLMLTGIGQCVSIIGSAYMTRLAIDTASKAWGLAVVR